MRLTSKIACQSRRLISSSGRPTWPRTPPALLTQDVDSPSRGFEFLHQGADRRHVGHVEAAALAGRSGLGDRLGQSVLGDVARQDPGADTRQGHRDGASEPVPCSRYERHPGRKGRRSRRGPDVESRERVEIAKIEPATALFDVVDRHDDAGRDRRRDTAPVSRFDDGPELRIDLRAPLADGEIAPDALNAISRTSGCGATISVEGAPCDRGGGVRQKGPTGRNR